MATTHRSDLVDELEKALRDEAYDGGFGYMGDEQFTSYVRGLAVTAAKVVEEGHTPTDDEREALRVQIAYRIREAVLYGAATQKAGESAKTQNAWIDDQIDLAMRSRAVAGLRRSEEPEWEYAWEADESVRTTTRPRGPRILFEGVPYPPETIASFARGRRIRRLKAGPWMPVKQEGAET